MNGTPTGIILRQQPPVLPALVASPGPEPVDGIELWIITRGEQIDLQEIGVVAGTREQMQTRIDQLEHDRLHPEPEEPGWEPPAVEHDEWDFKPLPSFLGLVVDAVIPTGNAQIEP